MAKDVYPNLAYGTITEAVAGTMAFSEIQSGVALFEKVAWLVSRIEYILALGHVNLLLDKSDAIQAGLVASNVITAFNVSDQAVIDFLYLQQADHGAAANDEIYTIPIIKDLSGLPGGGILIPPTPLYVAVRGISLAAVTGVEMRIYFTYIQLKPEEYWELVESRRIVS